MGEAAAAADDTSEARRTFLEALPLAVRAQAKPIVLDINNLLGLVFQPCLNINIHNSI